MTAPMPDLAAIIEEGERLLAAHRESLRPDRFFGVETAALRDLAGWAVTHGPTLLAVAKAAVLVRREASVETTHSESRCACVRCQRMRAFDAAVRGDAGEGGKL